MNPVYQNPLILLATAASSVLVLQTPPHPAAPSAPTPPSPPPEIFNKTPPVTPPSPSLEGRVHQNPRGAARKAERKAAREVKEGRSPQKIPKTEEGATATRVRIEWTAEMKADFENAYESLERGRQAKNILKILNQKYPELTLVQVDSHLRSYRNQRNIMPEDKKNVRYDLSNIHPYQP